VGVRNYLVEGVSGAGKTTVAEALERRGFHVVHGDRTLAYQGDPVTGAPTPGVHHEHHIWPVDRVRAIAADHGVPVTFFCGGSRNHAQFLDVLDAVFVLDVDRATLEHRLDARPADEYGGTPHRREHVLALHATQEDVPDGIRIDATQPVEAVVDTILRLLSGPGGA